MSNPANKFSKDLYKLLHIPRTATQNEIKQSYRRIALALHPDRHDGCQIKSDEFKEASEAYRILSDFSKRVEYDRWLDGVDVGADGRVRKRGMSRAAERNPHYRKVYSPKAPPGFKIFDRQRHYDMHYGDGMMREEIERARRRAEAASSRKSGYSYQSPLGNGFSFDAGRPTSDQRNPYSRRRHSRGNSHLGGGGDEDIRIEYEESYFDMNGGSGSISDFSQARNMMKGKEYVVERMKDRRKHRIRERGQPNPYAERRKNDEELRTAESSGCAIM
mmetsp:Transcript_27531/g.56570  ORF Transcript_27531/g.56570 Transcript_27531/m.56570 type:complete len:275 (+) Transcript_27531:54-878(+)